MAGQTLMEKEARETPAVAARLVSETSRDLRAVGERLRLLSPRFALAAGRGSSDAAAYLAKYLFELKLGVPTVSAAPSVTSIYGRTLNLERALVLAVSQSGRSPDLVDFCIAARGPDVIRIGLINDTASPLADAVDVCLPLLAGPEQSVAATKSCLSAMTMALGVTAHWSADKDLISAFERMPDVLAKALEEDWTGAEAFFDGDGPVYVAGRGPGLAIAAEAALKLKETNALHAEAVSAAEIRHGPFALAGADLRVVMFAQRDAAFDGLKQLARDLQQRGSRVLFISADPSLEGPRIGRNAEPVAELLSMLLRFYLLVSAAALRRGRSPDAPPMLTKITETR